MVQCVVIQGREVWEVSRKNTNKQKWLTCVGAAAEGDYTEYRKKR
jgi:hypothetical protein